jgi:hypothetical protein
MFVDKLSARIVIFRHYLEFKYNDSETFNWTQRNFNLLLQRKVFIDFFNKNIDDITKPLRVSNDFEKLIVMFIEDNNIDFTKDIYGLKRISNLYFLEKDKIHKKFNEFDVNFSTFENRFLVIQFDDFKNQKEKFDKSLFNLYLSKLEYLDTILNILWLLIIHRYLLQILVPNLNSVDAYQKLSIKIQDVDYILTHKSLFNEYLKLYSEQFFEFNTNLSDTTVRLKYPHLLDEIALTLHSGGIFVTKNKYNKIMEKVSRQTLHIELLLSAYDGYDFETAQNIVRKIIPSL